MKDLFYRLTATGLILTIGVLPAAQAVAQSQPPSQPPPPTQSAAQVISSPQDLRPILNKGYVELFQTASTLQIQPQAAQQLREQFKSSEDACRRNFRSHSSLYSKQIDAARAELKKGGEKLTWQQRHVLHCRIQNLQMLKSEADILASHAIPTAYDNLGAKLDLLQQWPEQHRMAVAELSSGIYQQRRWADVKDIGFRQIAAGQKDDIRRGQQAVEEMRRTGLLPPPLENKAIQAYVRNVAMKVAHNSDLQVPLHIEVINSREINAFALPGGYLFIERGLLDAADDESELAGVIAHEIAHDTARHAAKLMKRATIAGIFYQAAQVAAIVLTGGVAGIGMYYALQYGFYGLGMVLNLKLLGVSRDYELEADQLGVQYAWKAGYDTSGFIRFFDKIATKKGYINGASWFRTHPPFYQRMVLSEREIMFLPKQAATPIVQTPQFEQMKKELAPIVAEAESEDANKPTLLITREEGCKPPRKIEYKPGQPIEDLCATPPQAVTGEGQ